MKIEQLYENIGKDKSLQEQMKKLLEQGDREALAAWVKEQGCDASLSEIKQYLIEKGEAAKESGELTPEQLDAAAGGEVLITIALATAVASAGIFGWQIGNTFLSDSACW